MTRDQYLDLLWKNTFKCMQDDELPSEEGYGDYGDFDDEDEDEEDFGGDEDDDDRSDFADPGGRSALRAATKDNPRNLPCPNCQRPNMLTPADKARGYQCDNCADRDEGGGW